MKEKYKLRVIAFIITSTIFVIAIGIALTLSNRDSNSLDESLEPGYPKDVVREPYYFSARTIEEETQLEEFMGIDPPGDDMDTWLSRKDLAGLEQWKGYWFDIFEPYGRTDLLTFIDSKFEGYKAKLPKEVCNCNSNLYNCADFLTHAEAQTCYEYCGGLDNDIHWLDGDDDGLACEGLS